MDILATITFNNALAQLLDAWSVLWRSSMLTTSGAGPRACERYSKIELGNVITSKIVSCALTHRCTFHGCTKHTLLGVKFTTQKWCVRRCVLNTDAASRMYGILLSVPSCNVAVVFVKNLVHERDNGCQRMHNLISDTNNQTCVSVCQWDHALVWGAATIT